MQLVQQLQEILGPEAVLHQPEDLMLYEYDGGVSKSTPDAVVFPRTTGQVVEVVKLAARQGVPLVARGAGTGLSGGAIPISGGIVIGFSRMNRIVELDLENFRAVVQAGVVNLDITQAVLPSGYFFAPDPSSQKACTIGGNVAENAGGPHTLAYGVTTNHVVGLEVVLPDGSVIHTGGKELDLPGYDLTGLLVGSEGTLGIVTQVVVRLLRAHEAVKTLLGVFHSVDDASRAVAEITARTITPAALEMLDDHTLRIVEQYCHAGYPQDAGAALLIELEGSARSKSSGRSSRWPKSAAIAVRERCGWRVASASASCSGWGARTPSAPSAAWPLTSTCKTVWSRAASCPRRCGSSRKPASATG